MKRLLSGCSIVLLVVMFAACSGDAGKGGTGAGHDQIAARVKGHHAPGLVKNPAPPSVAASAAQVQPVRPPVNLAGITSPGDGSEEDPAVAVVATVGGEPITASQLAAESAGALQKVQKQIYDIQKQTLNQMIDDKLVSEAAAREGMTPQAYLVREVDGKVEAPSDKDIEAFYEQRKNQIRQPFDQIKGRIADHLKMTAQKQARDQLMNKLRKAASVQVFLEPPRVQVALEEDIVVVGADDAGVLIIEFSDFQCPFSKRAQGTVEKVLKEYKGNVRYAFLDFPLGFHQQAPKATRLRTAPESRASTQSTRRRSSTTRRTFLLTISRSTPRKSA